MNSHFGIIHEHALIMAIRIGQCHLPKAKKDAGQKAENEYFSSLFCCCCCRFHYFNDFVYRNEDIFLLSSMIYFCGFWLSQAKFWVNQNWMKSRLLTRICWQQIKWFEAFAVHGLRCYSQLSMHLNVRIILWTHSNNNFNDNNNQLNVLKIDGFLWPGDEVKPITFVEQTIRLNRKHIKILQFFFSSSLNSAWCIIKTIAISTQNVTRAQ